MNFTRYYKGLAAYWQMSYIRHKTAIADCGASEKWQKPVTIGLHQIRIFNFVSGCGSSPPSGEHSNS